jgi:hypothetical protein
MQRHALEVKARMFAPRPALKVILQLEPESAPEPEIEQECFITPDAEIPEDFEKFTVHPLRRLTTVVARATGVSYTELRSHRRLTNFVKARQILFYIAKNTTHHSLPEIGRRLGGKDHTTVLHAVRKVQAIVDRLNIELPETPAEMAEALWAAEWPKASV